MAHGGAVAAVLITAVMAAGCEVGDSGTLDGGAGQDRRVVEIDGAQLGPDGSLFVNVNVCNADTGEADVNESDDEVRIDRANRRAKGGGRVQ